MCSPILPVVELRKICIPDSVAGILRLNRPSPPIVLCTMMRKVISNLTKSTLKGPGGTQRRLSKGNLDVMQSAHSPPPRVTCKVAKILLSVDSTEKTQWVKEPLS